jgi:broad specificity phosphatase PhoE
MENVVLYKSQMTIFYICRHGETVNNKEGRFSGWYDTPLTEKGVLDAESCADKLQEIPIDFIVSSDLGRAVATAEIISRGTGFNGEIVRLEGLREVNYGDFANQPHSIYPELSPLENAEFVSPNGESLVHMQTRVLDSIHTLSVAHPDQSVLLVAHDGTINAIRSAYTSESIGIADTVRNPHDGLTKFEYDGNRVISFEEL